MNKKKLVNFIKNLFLELFDNLKDLLTVIIIIAITIGIGTTLVGIIGLVISSLLKAPITIQNIFDYGVWGLILLVFLGVGFSWICCIVKSIVNGIINTWKRS